MTSNASTLTGDLPAYSISNITLEKNLKFNISRKTQNAKHNTLDTQLKLALNNIFDAEYLSVLSHPMPGFNAEFFLSISW